MTARRDPWLDRMRLQPFLGEVGGIEDFFLLRFFANYQTFGL
jgi:hypothetical protein